MSETDAQADSPYMIEIETLQPSNLKGAMTALKEQLDEASLCIDEEGIKILQMDKTHIVVAQMELKASNFDKYICKQPCKLGLDIHTLTKILKGVGANDMLTLFVEDSSMTGGAVTVDEAEHQQQFGIRVENAEKGQVSTFYVDLKDLNEDELAIPDLDYPYLIQMPASDFQSIINTLKNMENDVVQLRYVKGVLSFFTKGDGGRLEITRSKTNKEDNSIRVTKQFDDADEIIEIHVKLPKLHEFTKCSSLSTLVTIYLKNDYPLFVEYDVGSLGFMRFGLSPHKKPDNF